jgi:hypothetical protein
MTIINIKKSLLYIIVEMGAMIIYYICIIDYNKYLSCYKLLYLKLSSKI